MRVAIIGAGISGLTAAYRLGGAHDVTVFEANAYVGGHTHTVDVRSQGESHAIDTGFIVFNDWTYPHFIQLINQLGIASRPTSMSFSVRCDKTGLEYNGTSLNGLFAQRRNLLRPSFHRLLRDVLKFNREGARFLEQTTATDLQTVNEFLADGRYSPQFAELYLLPMGSAIWSCPHGMFREFPIRFVLEFYRNHGLLQIAHRPTWRVIDGGSRQYVRAIENTLTNPIQTNSPVQRVRRNESEVWISLRDGRRMAFDHVVLACHSDQALRMLEDATPLEQEVLNAFPYERNVAVLHTDERQLPRSRRAWASWNYLTSRDEQAPATLTYCMNILQQLRSRQAFCVTLNREDQIDRATILGRYEYEHPVFTTRRAAAQSRHFDLLNFRRTSYCGAYWGNGFHEDGVVSALKVCRALEASTALSPQPAELGGSHA